MARWRIECQSCSKALAFGDSTGVAFPCDADECCYTPYQTIATSQAVPYSSSYKSVASLEGADKMDESTTATLDLGEVSAEVQTSYNVPCLLCGEPVEVTPYSPIYCICDRCEALWKELVVSRAIDNNK